MRLNRLSKARREALALGYRSNFEKTFADLLKRNKLKAEYEPDKLKFIQPEQKRTYCPDWKIRKGVYIETKGRFTGRDRKKTLWVRESNPGVTAYMLFMRSSVKITKTSKTSYGDWCDKHGIIWADIKDTRKWKGWFK